MKKESKNENPRDASQPLKQHLPPQNLFHFIHLLLHTAKSTMQNHCDAKQKT
jgi:hypothetical protein